MASTEMEQTEGYKNEERKKGLQVDLRNRGTERERERERESEFNFNYKKHQKIGSPRSFLLEVS